ncbi:MAG: hypothetical protein KBD78_04975 [Oligoflexales bacterium]|nr:hypothetical protein [Oligoflexales bacterium]
MIALRFLSFCVMICISTKVISKPAKNELNITKVHCLGDAGLAENTFIFLEGLRELGGADQTYKKNFAQLKAFSEKYPVQVVIPEVDFSCKNRRTPDAKIACWTMGLEAKETLLNKWKLLRTALQSCQDKIPEKKRMTVQTRYIGFSNGGYFLNRLYQLCSLEQLKGRSYVAVGMAGVEPMDRSYKICGSYMLAIGSKDVLNYKKAKTLYEKFLAKNAAIKFYEYSGGHYLTAELLEYLLNTTW